MITLNCGSCKATLVEVLLIWEEWTFIKRIFWFFGNSYHNSLQHEYDSRCLQWFTQVHLTELQLLQRVTAESYLDLLPAAKRVRC